MIKIKRTFSQILKPILVLVLIGLCALTFINHEISYHLGAIGLNQNYKGDPPGTADYINWSLYGLSLIMTLWSLYMMVFSSPGYIEHNQRYNADKMSTRDRFLFKYIQTLMHSTTRQ